jgi:hypothetical protein
MTIGEYVDQRAKAIRYLAVLWLVTHLFAVMVFPERFANFEFWQIACYQIPFFLLYYILARTTRCPRCHQRWEELVWKKANPVSSEMPDRCQSCGVSFDEPL